MDRNCDGLNKIYKDCRYSSSVPSTKLSSIDGRKICGKRRGKSFLEAIRPTYDDGMCPEGFELCYPLEGTSNVTVQNSLCVESGKQAECPITGIAFDLETVPENLRDTYSKVTNVDDSQ
jgi:hypothetical protein